ncbi:serine/threonine-protein kinase [Melittangium boletus]|uniref:Protein kinase domain-containing protein n=1 Tax=Melittangium boletus DSM 14713 TaxID=1294270 RepID=A0A250IG58_9BACT|nr:serine/threonine-protein kinase [Melittangium boletus]ATB30755.1 hypothetical protein MEBOL_004217 [Melittangium boletus DSM 14713]
MTGPSRDNPLPLLRPQGPDGLLFEGPEYRYTYVSTLLDDHEESNPLVIARRTSLDEMDIPCLVTLKQVTTPAGEERRDRAIEEVQLATQLDHPAIARVYGLEIHQGEPFVVMEYNPGIFLQTALETALLQGRTLSPAYAVFIAAEMADAIHYAWNSQGEDGQPLRVVHRAIHPMQIRLENGGRVKLLDFGMAYSQLEGRTRTLSQRLRADPTYAAPEVMRQEKPDGRADVYSLGLVLLEMVSGRYPLDPPDVAMPVGESPAVARYNARVRAERASWASLGELADRILHFGPEDVERVARDVPEPLKRILHKALRPHPDDRYPSGGELRAELCAWQRTQGKRFGRAQAAAELRALMRQKPSPQDTRAFPLERGVLLTPEEAETARRKGRG